MNVKNLHRKNLYLQNSFFAAKQFFSSLRELRVVEAQVFWKRCLSLRVQEPRSYWDVLGYGRKSSECSATKLFLNDIYTFFQSLVQESTCTTLKAITNNQSNSTLQIPLLDKSFSVEEVKSIMKKLSSSSSAGKYSVSTEAMKILTSYDSFCMLIASALYHVYSTGITPPEWLEGVLTPVPKAGKEPSVQNLRPIVVLSLPCKILSSIIAKRIELWAGLNNNQAGFRSGRNIEDQIFILHTLLHTLAAHGLSIKKKVYAAFIDYTNAFDMVNHEKLWSLLAKKGRRKCFYVFWNINTEMESIG